MDRYGKYGPDESTPLTDGDTYFLGFKSRYQPTYLKPGELYYSGNMRLDRGTAKVRKGLKSLSTDVTLVNAPIIADVTALALDVGVSSITSVATAATCTTLTAHGYATGKKVNMRGSNQTPYNGDFSVTSTGTFTFTYTLSGATTSPSTGTSFANGGPQIFDQYTTQVVGSGDYADNNTNTEGIIIATTANAYLYRYGQSTLTLQYPANEVCTIGQPCSIVQYLNKVYMFRGYSTTTAAPGSMTITQAAGTATATTGAAHGLASNSWVLISGASPDGYNGIAQITVTGGTTFTYTVSGALASPATGTIIYRPVQPPMSWDLSTTTHAFVVVPTGPNAGGAPLINMPAADWGVPFASRMVLPWSRDQIIMSDLLGAGTYDPSQTQFRILPGTNDWIIGAFPYQQARILILYRKSVHAIFLDGTLAIAASYELTRTFGCVARRTVVNCGPYIMWLSDTGIVTMDVNNELSLQKTSSPLSDDINDIFQTVNWGYASNAVAAFWNNRYFVALPTGTQTLNQTVLVYNFLNDLWESVDTFPGTFDVVNFHVITYNGTKRLHAVSSYGYVSLLEENDTDQWGQASSQTNYAITGNMKTRNFLAGTHDIKSVRRFQLEANLTSADSFTSQYVLTNPDYTPTAQTYTAAATSDVTLRMAVGGRRGTSGRLEVLTQVGRPEFTSVLVESKVNSRFTTNYT